MPSKNGVRGACFSVQRRTSVRRPRAMRSTIGTEDVLQPVPLARGCSLYTLRSVPPPVRPAPSDRTICAAKTAGLRERRSGLLPAPSSPSAIEALCWPAAAAGLTRERDCLLLRRRANRTVPFHNRGQAFLVSDPPPSEASKTWAPAAWYPDSDPSTRRLCLQTSCPTVDIALWAGFRAGATLRTATRYPDTRGAIALLTYSWKQCALSGRIVSSAAQRTEVRRSTLKRAPLDTGSRTRAGGDRA